MRGLQHLHSNEVIHGDLKSVSKGSNDFHHNLNTDLSGIR